MSPPKGFRDDIVSSRLNRRVAREASDFRRVAEESRKIAAALSRESSRARRRLRDSDRNSAVPERGFEGAGDEITSSSAGGTRQS